jgi:Uncharacterized alpha/beta hydrolase domain (DUF2235)
VLMSQLLSISPALDPEPLLPFAAELADTARPVAASSPSPSRPTRVRRPSPTARSRSPSASRSRRRPPTTASSAKKTGREALRGRRSVLAAVRQGLDPGRQTGWRSGPAGWSGRSALLEAVLLVTVDNLGAGLAGDYEIQADRSPSSKRATKRKAFFHHRTRLRPVARCHRWSTRIIRMWEPGGRIILFGFSRSTFTLCCFAAVLGQCCRRGWLTLLAAPARRRNDHPHRTRKRSRRFRQPYGSDAAGMDAVPRQMAAAICASLHTELGWFLTHPCVADSVERRQNRWRVSSQRRNLRELVLAVRT